MGRLLLRCEQAALSRDVLGLLTRFLRPESLRNLRALFQGLTCSTRIVDWQQADPQMPQETCDQHALREASGLPLLFFAQQEPDQFFEALLNIHGLQRSGIGLRRMRLDET